MRVTRAGSAQANIAGSSTPDGGGNKWRTAANGRTVQGFSAAVRNTMSASRPPGFIAWRTLENAAIGSLKNITPKRENTRSKLAGSKGWAETSVSATSAWRKPAAAIRSDALATDLCE